MSGKATPPHLEQQAGARSWWKSKRRPGRMQSSLVALSAAAIASVYAVGYVQTSDAGGDLASLVTQPVTSPAAPSAPTQPSIPRSGGPGTAPDTGSTGRRPQAPSQRAPATTPTPQAAAPAVARYTDGTYVGLGNSRHGSIEATVVVQDGRVVSAQVSRCGTRYSCSKIQGLESRVLTAQAATPDFVSGSTDSSRAYMGAVANALSQARV